MDDFRFEKKKTINKCSLLEPIMLVTCNDMFPVQCCQCILYPAEAETAFLWTSLLCHILRLPWWAEAHQPGPTGPLMLLFAISVQVSSWLCFQCCVQRVLSDQPLFRNVGAPTAVWVVSNSMSEYDSLNQSNSFLSLNTVILAVSCTKSNLMLEFYFL